MCEVLFFFFQSRGRHTSCSGDWSSDVCSSDLSVGTTLEPPKSLPPSNSSAKWMAMRWKSPPLSFSDPWAKPTIHLYRCKRSEEHTSELQSRLHLVCRLLLEKKKKIINQIYL